MKRTTLFISFCASILIMSALRQESLGQAPKKVILEDFTGTTCGWCPRGITAMEKILTSYPNAIGMSNHAYTATSKLNSAYSVAIDSVMDITIYPNGTVDRFLFPGNTKAGLGDQLWASKVVNRLLTTTPVAVSFTSTYNSGTRVLDVIVTADFVAAASGDMRISCVLMEDGITGYPQNNALNGDPTSPWYQQGSPIVNFVHNHVTKVNLANDIWGTAGVIPASVAAGSTYTTSYTYTLPANWPSPNGAMPQTINTSQVHIVAFVSYYGTAVGSRSILNACKGMLGGNATGIQEDRSITEVEVKQNMPNPFVDHTAIQFWLNTTDHVNVKVYNVFGKEVITLHDSRLVPGEHTLYWFGDNNDGAVVAGGVYYYTISTSAQQVSGQMIFIGH